MTCNYLKAVNNQDKKKFKNMEVTGIVNTQCSHVFIRASVDLEFGERYGSIFSDLVHTIDCVYLRYVNVDAVLAHAL